MLRDSSLSFNTFFLKTGSKCFICSISVVKGWQCNLNRLNLHLWSCVHGWAVSTYEDDTRIYCYSWVLERYVILSKLPSETSMHDSGGNGRTEKKWTAHRETNTSPSPSPTTCANWATRREEVNIGNGTVCERQGCALAELDSSSPSPLPLAVPSLISAHVPPSPQNWGAVGRVWNNPWLDWCLALSPTVLLCKVNFTLRSNTYSVVRKKYNFICYTCSVRTRKSIAISMDHRWNTRSTLANFMYGM